MAEDVLVGFHHWACAQRPSGHTHSHSGLPVWARTSWILASVVLQGAMSHLTMEDGVHRCARRLLYGVPKPEGCCGLIAGRVTGIRPVPTVISSSSLQGWGLLVLALSLPEDFGTDSPVPWFLKPERGSDLPRVNTPDQGLRRTPSLLCVCAALRLEAGQ